MAHRDGGVHPAVTGTRIYRFRLTGSGRISGYALVPGGDLGAVFVFQITATPDGSQLAAETNPGNGAGQLPSIQVVNTQTGARSVWHNGTGVPGTARYRITDLSWVVSHNPQRGGHPANYTVVKVSAVTGRTLRVLFVEDTGHGGFYRSFSTDPSTRFMILNAGPTSGTRNGWIDHGRLVTLKPANGSNVFYETW